MSGPHKLGDQTITDIVTRISAGVYILTANGKSPDYVGRSDYNLAERLKSWVNAPTRYTHFWFEYASSPKNAFDLECQWYHKYDPADNDKHPQRPQNSSLQCPICNIFDGR